MAESDFQADRPQPPRRRVKRPRPIEYDDEDDGGPDDAMQTIIPYKNALALVAYYSGVFSLVPIIGAILGPAAVALGFLGYRYGRRHPTAKGTGHAVAGIVFGLLGSLCNVTLIVATSMYALGWGPGKK